MARRKIEGEHANIQKCRMQVQTVEMLNATATPGLEDDLTR